MFECVIPLVFAVSRAVAGKRLANKRDEKMGGQEVEEKDLARSGSKSRRAGFTQGQISGLRRSDLLFLLPTIHPLTSPSSSAFLEPERTTEHLLSSTAVVCQWTLTSYIAARHSHSNQGLLFYAPHHFLLPLLLLQSSGATTLYQACRLIFSPYPQGVA